MPALTPYGVAFTRGVLRAVSRPGDLAVRVGFYLIILIVTASLWRAALDANDGNLAGYDRVGLLWYIAAAQAAQLGPRPRTIEEVGDEIGAGTVAVQMLRPVSVVGLRIAAELGEAVLRVLIAALVASVGLFLTVGAPHSAASAALALPAALLGCTLSVTAQHACGGIAFWLLDARATWFLWSKLVFLLGGLLIPLELLPAGLGDVAKVLPWASMTYVSGRLASGDLDPLLVVGQLVWLVVAGALAAGVFALGERRLQVVGG
jgi:viologen exporter family transport system permease protein